MKNKYFRAAADLVIRYPLTRFARVAEGCSALFSEEVPEVYIVGFGSLGREVFLSLARNSVFLSHEKEKPQVLPVDYNIFTTDTSLATEFLNSAYKRCGNIHKEGIDEYLPLPPYTSREQFFETASFQDALAPLLNKLKDNSKGGSVVILCSEDKRENLALAKRFVRDRDSLSLDFNLLLYSDKACDGCFSFGFDTRGLFEKYLTAAKVRNIAYGRDISHIALGDALALAEDLWDKLDTYAKRSNLFAAVSLPFKLAALDFTVSPLDENALTYGEYLTEYKRGDRRLSFCIQEHYRWCAALITEGYAPPRLSRILNERRVGVCGKAVYTDGKSSEEKLHPHLTDMAGLVRFAELTAERDGVMPAERDVIKYDFEILDFAWHILRAAGLGIYRV